MTGLSIAWAVAEFISDKEKCGAKTLFATHYHELTELEEKLEGIKNYSIAVKEKGEDIIFLRKSVRGGTDESRFSKTCDKESRRDFTFFGKKKYFNRSKPRKTR